jgi:hypothetical protein
MQHPCLDKYHMCPGLRLLLERALQNQDTIGWKYAMRGYFSTSWVDAEHHFRSGLTHEEQIRQSWLKQIIQTVWVLTRLCGSTGIKYYTRHLCLSETSAKVLLTNTSEICMHSNMTLVSLITYLLTLPWKSASNVPSSGLRSTGSDLLKDTIHPPTNGRPSCNYSY